jgi:hypothetical protein
MSKVAKEMAEIRQNLREMAKASADAWKAIGELGNKWGTYTEGEAAPAVDRVLREKFGANTVIEHATVRKRGASQEFDTIGIVNGKKNQVILTEIKSNLTEGELKKFEKKFADFFEFFPEYRGMTLLGLLVAVQMPQGMPDRVARRGFYLMRPSDSSFDLLPPPKDFHPRTLKG